MSLVKKLAVQTAPDVTTTYDIGADAQNIDYGNSDVKTRLDLLGTSANLNVAASGNASSTEVVKGDDTRLIDARTPVSHTHTTSDITDFPTLGTAAAKDSTNAVTANSTDLVESGAVKTAIDAAISSVYKPSGDKTVAQLTSALLIASNLGNVYNITDSGTTTADFVGGQGAPIHIGDNVAIVDRGSSTYKFDLLSGLVDLSSYIQKSSIAGLVKNDGSIDQSDYAEMSDIPDTSNFIEKVPVPDDWSPKTWNGLTSFQGGNVWTDGDNIYYSYESNQYVLDKSTSTWLTKTWNGLPSDLTYFYGSNIQTDGDNIYYSGNSNQLVLNKNTSTWSTKTWNGFTPYEGYNVWTDGDNIYFSYNTQHYVLDKSTSTWSTKTWNELTMFDGQFIWADGDNIYYSNFNVQRVLDKSTSTWLTKTQSGLTVFDGYNVWTDGDNIYYSSGTTQRILDKLTSTWSTKTWSGLTSFNGSLIWTDGDNIYCSNPTNQYVFNKPIDPPLLKADGSTDTNKYAIIESGDMKFGVDSSGNYGYIKAGADTVTPFKTGEVSVLKTTTSVSSGSSSYITDLRKGDLICTVTYGSTAPTFYDLTTTLLASGYGRSSSYGYGRTYVVTSETVTSSTRIYNGTSYTMQYQILRIS